MLYHNSKQIYVEVTWSLRDWNYVWINQFCRETETYFENSGFEKKLRNKLNFIS